MTEFNKWQASLTVNGDMVVIRSGDEDEFRKMLTKAAKIKRWMKKGCPVPKEGDKNG